MFKYTVGVAYRLLSVRKPYEYIKTTIAKLFFEKSVHLLSIARLRQGF
jgi:hypothetical protein